MSCVYFEDQMFDITSDESVLDCLLRNHQDVPYSCKSGTCQSCMMQALEGIPSDRSQNGLKPTYRVQNYVLSCQWKPDSDVRVKLPDLGSASILAEIIEILKLNHNVTALRLLPLEEFTCNPGQYITLITPENVVRCYSIANLPTDDGYIEIHMRLLKSGQMSEWVRNRTSMGMHIRIRGPAGNCFYVPEENQKFPMLLAGTGTGLAPLCGIARDALGQCHSCPIHLYHGALELKDLYYQTQLRNMSKVHSNFSYIPCVLNSSNGRGVKSGNIENIVLSNLQEPQNTHAYFCGAPEFVNSIRKKVFLAGIASKNIYHDSFLIKNDWR